MNLPLAPRRIGEGGRQLAELSQIPAAAPIDRSPRGLDGPSLHSSAAVSRGMITALHSLQLHYVCDRVRSQRTLL